MKLVLVSFWVTLQRLYDLFWVILLDYSRSLRFFLADLRLNLTYFLRSPYAISKAYLTGEGEAEIYAYGETPIRVLRKIARLARITSKDTFYDLGCGPGRTCLWFHHRVGCRAIGVEQVPTFAQRATKFTRGPTFIEGDYCDQDYSDASVIYLYGTYIPGSLETLRPGARVVTVSYPLDEGFETLATAEARFPWGKTELYLNRRR